MNSPSPVVTFCVLTFEGADIIGECLDAVQRVAERISARVIVTDNGSGDGTADLLHRDFPSVELIINLRNEPFTVCYNRMLHRAQSPYALILSNDVVLSDPECLLTMIGRMEADERVAAAAPRSIRPCGTVDSIAKRQTSYRELLRDWTWIGSLGPSPRACEPYDLQGVEYPEILQDSCLLVRTDTFAEVGGFDERLRLFYTEDDLCMRLRRYNYKLLYCGDVSVVHRHRYSTRRMNPMRVKWVYLQDMLHYSCSCFGSARTHLLLSPLARAYVAGRGLSTLFNRWRSAAR